MSRDPCAAFELWLSESDLPVGVTGVEPADRDAMRHRSTCPHCHELEDSYAGAIDSLRSSLALEMPDALMEEILDAQAPAAESGLMDRVRGWWNDRPSLAWAPAVAWCAALVVGIAGLAALHEAQEIEKARGDGEVANAVRALEDVAPDGALLTLPTERPGAVIAAGSVVEARDQALTLSDGNLGRATLQPASVVRVDQWTRRVVRLSVIRGSARFAVRGLQSHEAFLVRTEYATIRVIGTEFVVQHLPGDATLITTVDGTVEVLDAEGRTVDVLGAGESARVPPEEGDADDGKRARRGDARVRTEPPAAVARDEDTETERLADARPDDEAPAATAAEPAEDSADEPIIELGPARGTRRPAPRASVRAGAASTTTLLRRDEEPVEAVPPSRLAGLSTAEIARRARRLLADGAIDEAISMLIVATTNRHGGSAELLATLADAYRMEGRYSGARRTYEWATAKATGARRAELMADLAGLYADQLGDREGAARTWERYLRARPDGPYAARALWAIAEAHRAEGRRVEQAETLRRILDEHRFSPEAVRALTRLGRDAIADRRWTDARDLFDGLKGSGHSALAEAAWIGLMRVRLGEGRTAEARSLLSRYRARFADGRRSAEADLIQAEIERRERGGKARR